MHGGASPGAPNGAVNGNYRHGRFTNEAVALRRESRAWIRQMEQIAEAVE